MAKQMGVTKTPNLPLNLENPYLLSFCFSEKSPNFYRKQIQTLANEMSVGRREGSKQTLLE